MRRCVELALLGAGRTSPNPMVGAAIVHEGKIIGEGYHQFFGGAHAEVNAISSVSEKNKSLLPLSTLFVTLEPCSHFGKTPPCVDLILKHQIGRIVIGGLDPNPIVNGKGIKQLKDNGVNVEIFPMKDIENLLLSTAGRKENKLRPKVILKFAQSDDGFIGKKGENIWLTNPYSKRLVHKWRGQIDGLLIGTSTAAIDDPALNTRYNFGKSPLRIVLDRNNRLDRSLKIFNQKYPTLIVSEKELDASNEENTTNLEFLQAPFNKDLLPHLLFYLKVKKGCNILMIEGGARTLQYFIDQDLWDEARIFKSSRKLGSGILAPSLAPSFLVRKLKILNDDLFIYENKKNKGFLL